jgi:hypothetical protein
VCGVIGVIWRVRGGYHVYRPPEPFYVSHLTGGKRRTKASQLKKTGTFIGTSPHKTTACETYKAIGMSLTSYMYSARVAESEVLRTKPRSVRPMRPCVMKTFAVFPGKPGSMHLDMQAHRGTEEWVLLDLSQLEVPLVTMLRSAMSAPARVFGDTQVLRASNAMLNYTQGVLESQRAQPPPLRA